MGSSGQTFHIDAQKISTSCDAYYIPAAGKLDHEKLVKNRILLGLKLRGIQPLRK